MAKRTCPNGHVIEDDTMGFCPQCGSLLPPVQQPEAPPQPPKRGLLGLWKQQGCMGKALLLVAALLAIGLSCAIVSAMFSGKPSAVPTAQPTKSVVEGVTPSQPTVAPGAANVAKSTEQSKPSATTVPTNEPTITRTPKPSATAVPTKEPTLTPTSKPVSKLIFAEIRGNHEKMTDAQWEVYRKPLIGQVVKWTGWVDEAKDKGTIGELWIDMDSPEETFSVQDVYFAVPKEDVLKYNKDSSITFQGEIKSITAIITSVQIQLDKVTVSK